MMEFAEEISSNVLRKKSSPLQNHSGKRHIKKVLMPSEVLQILTNSLTLSHTGRSGHYQGGDAILEEINKEATSWMPGGVPTDAQWIRTFRNMDDFKEVIKR